MALMDTTIFKGYADRIAKQYSYVKVCFDTLSNTAAGTEYYDRITQTEDPDVELAMLTYAYNADEYFQNQATQTVIRSMTSFTTLINAFENHLSREGSLSDRRWDTYCTDQDVRVSDYTNKVHYARLNRWMLARNVFAEDSYTFATGEMTGASTLTFTDGDDFGDGDAANYADGDNFAGSQLKVVVTGSNTISSLIVNIEGLDEEGGAKTISNVTISGAPGVEINIGTVSDRWVDITGVTRVSGGTTGDEFEIQNIKEREISL